MSDQPLTGCHGILKHTDTVWKRCPKADTCERYLTRREAGPMTPVVRTYCQTPEFEHYREAT